MNHIYRIIWSECTGTWVAVPETGRSCGKGGTRAARKVLQVALIASGFAGSMAMAIEPATTVVPVNGGATAYISANGVPVVNIEKANAAGLSHNTYTNYNVEKNGLVLNNGNSSQLMRQSELAGQVAFNPNLASEAKVILNEVVSTSRSVLAGFTEVLGGKADVIVVNPNGITCNGCGFINTDRATLATGTSNIAADGSLTGFSVNRGDVLIEGLGAVASAQQVFDIVARSVSVFGKINVSATGSLGVTTGNNVWNYTDRKVTGSVAGNGPAPSYAFDSSVLGGMYAGRIRIIATEGGVGVRMLGEAAVSGDDFSISSAGKLEMRAALSAARDISLTTTSGSGNQDLSLNGATITAGRDLSLSAANGQVALTGGALYAANDLALTGATLLDFSSAGDTRFAVGDTSLTTSGAANIDGSVWGAGGSLSANVDSLAIGNNGATLYAGTTLALTAAQDLSLATAAVRAVGDISLASTSGRISNVAGAAQGIESTAGNLMLSAATGLDNAGTISSNTGSVSARINGTLSNSGTLHAGTTLNIADQNDGSSEAVINSGTLIADDRLIALMQDLTNRSNAVVQGTGSMSLRATTGVSNDGVLQSDGTLGIVVGSPVAMSSITNTGKILGAGDVSLTSNYGFFNVSNSGLLQSAGVLTVGSTGRRVIELDNTGAIVGRSVVMAGNVFNNAGSSASVLSTVAGGGDVKLDFTGLVSNDGVLHADQALAITAGGISASSTSGISSDKGDLSITSTGNVSNRGWFYTNSNMILNADGHEIRNTETGNIEATGQAAGSTGAITFDTGTTGSFFNANYIKSAGNLTITTGSFVNQAGDVLPAIIDAPLVYTGAISLVGDSGNFSCNSVGSDCAHSRLYQYTFTSDQSYSSALGSPAQLLSTGDITLNYSTTAVNTMSVISGHNVSINGATGSSNFENNDIGLKRLTYYRLLWIRSGDDYINYIPLADLADAEDIYKQGLDNHNAREPSTYWHTERYLNTDDPDNPEQIAFMKTGYAMQAGYIALPGQAPSSAGIYASGTFSYAGPGISLHAAAQYVPTNAPTTQSVTGSLTNNASVVFQGLNLTLPTNPNGLYIVSQKPDSDYLVETNPIYGAGSGVGSNYLAQILGFDPDAIQKRLGDANYETQLVRNQLIAQTNNFVLNGYASEETQMKGLMDNAASQNAGLGLTFGTALTADQASRVGKDMVWMVSTVVNGQSVLAPVVYLSAATRNAVLSGSVIAAHDVSVNAQNLSNTGGTIQASNTLAVTTSGDIANTSGKIQGGDVSLKSTAGNIVNQTSAEFFGNDITGQTVIGATATIAATGNLNIDASKDVKVIGATVKAGGDASITAGNDVVFDTIQDKTAVTSAGSSSGTFSSSSWSRNEINTKQIGSSLDTGGNLSIKSGNDVTVAGSKINAGGNVAVDATNNLNVIDRQDVNQLTTTYSSTSTGVGASGSSVSVNNTTKTETVKTTTGTSVASSITSGGDTRLAAGETLTVRGSDIAAAGDLDVKGKDVQVLAGQNTFDQTIDTKTTTVGLSVGVDVSAISKGIDMVKGDKPSAADVAKLGAQAYGAQGVSVGVNMTTTTTHSEESNSTARVSTFSSGGATKVTAQNIATFEGTQVNAGGDIKVTATDINMVAARNTSSYTSESNTTGLSVSLPTDPSALARKAVADNAYSGGGGGVTLATVSNAQTTTADTGDKGTVSSFKSGGSMTRTASDTINDQGTQITAAGDFKQDAKVINMVASTDTSSHLATEVSHTGTLGVSVDFEPVKAIKDLKSGDPRGLIGLASGPSVGVDGTYTRNDTTSRSGTTTAVVGNVIAGGSISSTSSGTTTLQGTNLLSQGDTSIAAHDLVVAAAADTQSSSNNGNTVTVAARGEVGVSGKPGGSLAGTYATNQEQSTASQAQTSAIVTGGNLTIKTTGDASFEGATLQAAKDASIVAGGSVNMTAAKDTSDSSSSGKSLTVGVSASKSGSKGASVGVTDDNARATSSDAVIGSIAAGNNLTISAGKNIGFEGTDISAGKDASISAVGDVNMQAATSTSSSNSQSISVGVSASQDKTSRRAGANVGVALAKADSTNQAGSGIAVGGNLNITSGGVTTMQGTQADVGGKANINAAGGVVKTDAVNESSSSGLKVYAMVQVGTKRNAGDTGSAKEAATTSSRSGGTDAVTEAPTTGESKPSVLDQLKSYGGKALEAAKSAKKSATQKKNSSSFPLAVVVVSDSSEHTTTGVDIRQGAAAKVIQLPLVAKVLAQPSVDAAVQVTTSLAGPLAQYGSQAAVPDSVKRDILAKAGVPMPSGANLDELLNKTLSDGKSAATSGLAGANISPDQQRELLQSIGLSR
ncbi:hemagglutinin repeat-containing protein [Quatrionicoccus australiensis]|uniref:hemagglutinin repeat-containing protein n=1 Tax=Quatrionicoccus australiensis TaxID=138118 RepID=UPI001CFA6B25|nr:hemagglutinin repeat-containing protein [Quatrionicoccus australiensis]MCB4361155.1 hemagglutinin repeat-containing protein [Quatrionicoccus australiensis]